MGGREGEEGAGRKGGKLDRALTTSITFHVTLTVPSEDTHFIYLILPLCLLWVLITA